MNLSESSNLPQEFAGARRFQAATLSWPEEIEGMVELFRNYVESGLSLHRRKGDVVRTRLPKPTVTLCHPRHVYRVLRGNVLNYPKGEDYEFLRPLLGNGIFVSEGDLWARQRRLLSPEFRPGAVPRFLPIFVDCVEALFEQWEKAGAGCERVFSDDMMRLTLWAVGGALFQRDFREEAERIGHALEICLEQGTLYMMSMGLLQPWMPTPGNRRAAEAERDLNRIVRGLIAKARAKGQGGGDMLSRIIFAKDEETGGMMSEQQVLDEVKSLILAGHETTSLALSWAFYLLSMHPDVEERLVEESLRVLGGRRPEAEDVPKLDMARRVFFETMRLYPPVPAVVRAVKEVDRFDGIELRPDERVALTLYTTHRHPEFWPDAERFDPDRFEPSKVEKLVPGSYVPFLIGRRACIGEHFAMLEGVVALSMIAGRYKLERVEREPIGTRPISTLRLARPLRMRVRKREGRV